MLDLRQSRELNRILFPDFPKTWPDRFSRVAHVLPILLVALIVYCEAFAITAWVRGLDTSKLLANIATVFVAFFVFLIPLFLLADQTVMWSTRRLRFGKKCLRIEPAKPMFVNWRDVLGWQIEPATSSKPLQKLSVEYRFNRKGTIRRSWSILLDQAQVGNFLRAMHEIQVLGRCSTPLLELKEPAVSKPRKQLPISAMWCFAIAYGLFIQGVPVLLIGIIGGSAHDETNRAVSESFKAFITSHFQSPAELRAFYIIVGALLCVAGAWPYMIALKRMKMASQVGIATST